MADDPWMHRSERMRCRTCMWFVPKKTPERELEERDETADERGPLRLILGRCRRHAPTMSGYPVVFETDWCGDHKLDETRAA